MIGIDIGSSWIKLAQVGKSGVEKLVARPLPDKLVQDGRIVSYEAMAGFLAEIVKSEGLKGKCAIALPLGASYVRRLTMPLMTKEQLKVNLPYEFRDYLEQGKEKFAFDYLVLSTKEKGELSEGMVEGEENQGSMELLAAAVSRELLIEYTKMFKRAGLGVDIIAPTECAFSNLIKNVEGPDSKKEYCIVDIGHRYTNIYIFVGSAYETLRVIDKGGEDMDKALSELRNIDEFVARNHKEKNHDHALDTEALRDVYESLSIEIMRALNFYKFNNPDSEIENIYFSGGCSNIKQLRDRICQATDMRESDITDLMKSANVKLEDSYVGVCAAATGIANQ